MAVGDKLRTWFPGVSSRRISEDLRGSYRSATTDLYQGFFGDSVLVPRLDISDDAMQHPPSEWAMTNSTTIAPLWEIAFHTGSLPIKVFEFEGTYGEDGRRDRKEAGDHPGYELLRKPNPDLTRNLLISGTVLSNYIFQRCAWTKVRDGNGKLIELWPVPGPYLIPLKSSRNIIAGYEVRIPGFDPKPIPKEDVVDHRLMSDPVNWTTTLSPLIALDDAQSWSKEASKAMRKLFRRALLQRLWIDLQGAELEDDARERLRAEVEVAQNRPDGVPIMESNALLKELAKGPNDTLLTNAIEQAEAVTRRVLGLPEKTDDLAQLYSHVIRPLTDSMTQEWERSLFTEWEDRPAFPEFQGFEITEGTPRERHETWRLRVQGGGAMPNEWRRASDLPPAEGGDVLLVPLNVVVLKDLVASGGDRTGLNNAKPPTSSSRGGFGGQEGRAVGGGSITRLIPKADTRARAMAVVDEATDEQLASARRQGLERWKEMRNRILSGRAKYLERRLRGVINEERRRLRALVIPEGENPKKGTPMGPFRFAPLERIMGESDDQLAALFTETFGKVAEEAYDAADLLMADPENAGADRPPARPTFLVQAMLASRAATDAKMFRQMREEAYRELEGSQTVDEYVDRLHKSWTDLSNHLVNVIGATETAWAFERSAVVAWEQAGYPQVSVVGEENEACSSGVCMETVGQRFGAMDVPTPMHPGCEHFAVPAGLEA